MALHRLMPAWVYRSELSIKNDLNYDLDSSTKVPLVFIAEFRHGNKFIYDMEQRFSYGNLKNFVSEYIKERAHHDMLSEVSFDHDHAIVQVSIYSLLKLIRPNSSLKNLTIFNSYFHKISS